MFGWFKKRARQDHDPQNLADAHALGQETGERMRRSIDAYLKLRGDQIGEMYLPVFQQRLSMLLAAETRAPERIAQQEWQAYLRELDSIERTLRDEVPERLLDVFAAAELVDLRPLFDRYSHEAIEAVIRRAGVEAAFVLIQELEASRAAHGLPPLDLPLAGDVGDLAALQKVYVLVHEVESAMRERGIA